MGFFSWLDTPITVTPVNHPPLTNLCIEPNPRYTRTGFAAREKRSPETTVSHYDGFDLVICRTLASFGLPPWPLFRNWFKMLISWPAAGG
jgi:hypothetical protein